MTWSETKCPVCEENTSGTLPGPRVYLYVKGKAFTRYLYPCNEHYNLVNKIVDKLEEGVYE